MVPFHTQFRRSSADAFLPGYLDSSRPKFVRYRRLTLAVSPPDFETGPGFFETDGRGFASRHSLPPRRIPGGRTTLSVNPGGIHAALPKGHTASVRGGYQMEPDKT